MNFQPTSPQMLFMLGLAFGRQELPLKDTRPELKRAEREKLVSHGLIRLEKRGRESHVILTEFGCSWLQEHLDYRINAGGAVAGEVLATLLPKLKAFLAANGLTLGEFLAPARATPPSGVVTGSNTERLVSMLRSLDSGLHQFVPLADLRSALPDLPRPSFDAAVLALQKQGRIVLVRIDEPWRRSPAIERGAIDVAGSHYHSAYLKS
jgi:hypothetical protein